MQNRILYYLMFTGLLLSTEKVSAQFEMGLGYVYADPKNKMGFDIERAHGIHLNLAYQIPETQFQLLGGVSIMQYGREKYDRDLVIDGETVTDLDMFVTNNIIGFDLTGRYFVLPNPARIEPYVQAQAGVSIFRTKLRIDDPREDYTSDCPKPLVEDVLAKDATFVGGGGIGIRFNLGKSERLKQLESLYVDLQANYVAGGQVSYMVVDEPGQSHTQNRNAEEVNLSFVSEAQPEVVHEYYTGSLYTSHLQMMNFRVLVGFYISK